MKSQVAIYDTHEKALGAIQVLNNHHFPMNHVSLLGKAEVIDDHIHVKSLEGMKAAPGILGVGAGTVVGLLTGIGAFAIPGFGFLYGAGALIGVIGGFELGLVSGGILTLLARIGIQDDDVVKVEEHLNEGKFLVVVKGSEEEIEKAKQILHTEGTHFDYVE